MEFWIRQHVGVLLDIAVGAYIAISCTSLFCTFSMSSITSTDESHPIYHEDLLPIIAQSLDWPSLIGWYALDTKASSLVLPEIRRRIFELISTFIPSDSVDEFFNILKESDGLICGSAVRHILLPFVSHPDGPSRTKATPFPRNLNIVVGPDRNDMLFSFFTGLSYRYRESRPDVLYRKNVVMLEIFAKVLDDDQVRGSISCPLSTRYSSFTDLVSHCLDRQVQSNQHTSQFSYDSRNECHHTRHHLFPVSSTNLR